MRKKFLVFISVLASFTVSAQSDLIRDIFRILPSENIYHLSLATRDSMLQGKTYYPSDNDSTEIVAYNYGISELVKDYLYVSMSFETEQRASGMIEIRSFKMLNGDQLVLVSKTGGILGVTYDQHEISTFIYGKDKKLVPCKKKIVPVVNGNSFMKPGIPGSLKKNILNNSNITFDLHHEQLVASLNSNHISNDEASKKWLRGDRILFDWVKDQFVVSAVAFY
jgi:hypothetical protein